MMGSPSLVARRGVPSLHVLAQLAPTEGRNRNGSGRRRTDAPPPLPRVWTTSCTEVGVGGGCRYFATSSKSQKREQKKAEKRAAVSAATRTGNTVTDSDSSTRKGSKNANNDTDTGGLILPDSPHFSSSTSAAASAAAPSSSPEMYQADVNPKSLIRTDLRPHLDIIGNHDEAPPTQPDESGVAKTDPSDMIDLKTLYDPAMHLPDKPDFSRDLASDGAGGEIRYETGNPLCDELIATIGVKGPMTTAEYMRMALRHPVWGYYTNAEKEKKDGDDDLFDDEEEKMEEDEEEGLENDDDWDITEPSEPRSEAAASGGGATIIGPRGDFTTAPEISQIFGETLLVWILTQYQALGKPAKIQLVEVGPGRGTLICDMLRSALVGGRSSVGDSASVGVGGSSSSGLYEDFAAALSRGGGVHLVEVGRALRKEQRAKLEELGSKRLGGYELEFRDYEYDDDGEKEEEIPKRIKDSAAEQDGSQSDSSDDGTITVQWHELLSSVPKVVPGTDESVPTFITLQEIIDALPVHSFQKTPDGWRERLVDVAIREKEPSHVSAASAAAASEPAAKEDPVEAAKRKFAHTNENDAVRRRYADAEQSADGARTGTSSLPRKVLDRKPRLRFVLPPDTTPALRTLLNVDKSGRIIGKNSALDDAAIGDILEVCPEGMMLAQDVASRVEQCGGAALIIDYGGEGSGDTLRAFRRHKQAHPLSSPGNVDLTADVDFAALREAVNKGMEPMRKLREAAALAESEKNGKSSMQEEKLDDNVPLAFGPITQGKFLVSMGVTDRVVHLIEKDTTTDEQAEQLFMALERLIQPDQMGERYKVLAIAREKDGIFAPPPF